MAVENPPVLTDPPTPPDPNDRTTFDSRAYALSTWFATLVTEMRLALTNVYNNALSAFSSASAAGNSAANSASYASQAQAWATQTGSEVVAGQGYGAKKYAEDAASSAATALLAPGTSATSSISMSIGSGIKLISIQEGKAFSVGQFVVIASTASPGNYMTGQVIVHDSSTGALTVNVVSTGGSGTFADWTISITSAAGATPAVDIALINVGVI